MPRLLPSYPHPSSLSTMPSVLVIDDDELIRETIREALELYGFAPVVTASGPREGVAGWRRHQPALVLCDARMPRGSGLEVLAALRAAGDEAPFVLMGTQKSEAVWAAGAPLGLDAYVQKPFGLDVLLEVLFRELSVASRRALARRAA